MSGKHPPFSTAAAPRRRQHRRALTSLFFVADESNYLLVVSGCSVVAVLITHTCCSCLWLALHLHRKRRQAPQTSVSEPPHAAEQQQRPGGGCGLGRWFAERDEESEEEEERGWLGGQRRETRPPRRFPDYGPQPPRTTSRVRRFSRSVMDAAAAGKDGVVAATGTASTYVLARGRRFREAWRLSEQVPQPPTAAQSPFVPPATQAELEALELLAVGAPPAAFAAAAPPPPSTGAEDQHFVQVHSSADAD